MILLDLEFIVFSFVVCQNCVGVLGWNHVVIIWIDEQRRNQTIRTVRKIDEEGVIREFWEVCLDEIQNYVDHKGWDLDFPNSQLSTDSLKRAERGVENQHNHIRRIVISGSVKQRRHSAHGPPPEYKPGVPKPQHVQDRLYKNCVGTYVVFLLHAVCDTHAFAFSASAEIKDTERVSPGELSQEAEAFQPHTAQPMHEDNADVCWFASDEQRGLESVACFIGKVERLVFYVGVLAKVFGWVELDSTHNLLGVTVGTRTHYLVA